MAIKTTDNGDAIEEEAEAIFQSLVTESLNLPGDHGIPHRAIWPASTTDTEAEALKLKLAEGKAFFHRHFVSVFVAIMGATLVELPVARLTSVLLRNEMYNTVEFTRVRLLGTTRHVFQWFKDGLENPSSESATDLYQVRKIHAAALKELMTVPVPPGQTPAGDYTSVLGAIRADLAHVPTPDYIDSLLTTTPTTPMSQFDMLLALLAAFFVLDLNPGFAGLDLRDCEGAGAGARGYEAFVYYVGVVGRYLGLADRFNIALHPNPAVRKAVVKKMSDRVMAPSYKNVRDAEFLTICYFAEKFSLGGLITSTAHLILKELLGVGSAAATLAQTSTLSRMVTHLAKSGIYLLRFSVTRWVANSLLMLAVQLVMAWLNWVTTGAQREKLLQKQKSHTNNQV